MKIDFTPKAHVALLEALRSSGYTFQTYADFINEAAERAVVLRHDIDARNAHALRFAERQHAMGVRGTYYFRIVKGSWDEKLIKKIYSLGHEVGLHYEDIAMVRRKHKNDYDAMMASAWQHFKHHLERLRALVPVVTICNHGSPLSPYDNKLLWEHYDYKSLGVMAEVYLDTDFSRVGYLTETGRCWNGSRFSIRDRALAMTFSFPEIRTTYDLAEALKQRRLPDHLMITIHPQRWTGNPLKWMIELVSQRIKNSFKYLIIRAGRR